MVYVAHPELLGSLQNSVDHGLAIQNFLLRMSLGVNFLMYNISCLWEDM
jgi:hypothetical protein